MDKVSKKVKLRNGMSIRISPLADDDDVLVAHWETLPWEDHEVRILSGGANLESALRGAASHLLAYAEAEVVGDAPRQVQLVGEAARYPLERARVHIACSVAKGWRRLGVARALIEELEGRARDEGIARLYADVTESNRDAVSFFCNGGWSIVPSDREGMCTFSWGLLPEHPFPARPQRL